MSEPTTDELAVVIRELYLRHNWHCCADPDCCNPFLVGTPLDAAMRWALERRVSAPTPPST